MTKPKVVKIYQANISLVGVDLTGSQQGMSIYSSGIVKVNNCNFYGNSYTLLLSSRTANVTISDSSFRENSYGVRVENRGSLVVHGCQFAKHTRTALQLEYGSSGMQTTNFNISENTFSENRQCIVMTLPRRSNVTLARNRFENGTRNNSPCVSIYVYQSALMIESNTFSRLSAVALYIYNQQRMEYVHVIQGNTMQYIDDTPLVVYRFDYAQTTIDRNIFNSNKVVGKSAGMYIDLNQGHSGNITLNDFQQNNGKMVIELKANSAITPGLVGIDANTFYMNVASLSTVATNTLHCNLHANIFSNPSTRYDLRVTADGDGFLNATYNWWGVGTADEVSERIWDKSDSPAIGRVLAEPFLVKPEISCSGVANCSGHGECVRPNLCECHSGWTGRRCSQFSCGEVYDCQGKGECVGPNTCRCNDGWLPPDCAQPTCYQVNNCSGRGVCVDKDR